MVPEVLGNKNRLCFSSNILYSLYERYSIKCPAHNYLNKHETFLLQKITAANMDFEPAVIKFNLLVEKILLTAI